MTTTRADLPPQAFAAALAALPIGPTRLAALLRGRTPEDTWSEAGDHRTDVGELWRRYVDAGSLPEAQFQLVCTAVIPP